MAGLGYKTGVINIKKVTKPGKAFPISREILLIIENKKPNPKDIKIIGNINNGVNSILIFGTIL